MENRYIELMKMGIDKKKLDMITKENLYSILTMEYGFMKRQKLK